MADSTTHKNAVLSRMTPGRWLALVLVVLAVIFIFQNTSTISISLAWLTIDAALWLVLLVVFAIGWIAGWLLGRRKPS
ncbi:LapA family protein [Rhodococcus gannanensis]|jgi:lipopolysaccharide assembly protein A|uniref:LapA family protein n=1 Tax=Rhodococcus gannanensis TaxID=1960308 RepID=A0ABW4P088_9NOCA